MIVRGRKVDSHYWIRCILACPTVELLKPLEMVVDTGATTTTVFSEFIGLNCINLKEGIQCETANGPRTPFLLNKPTLLFRTTKEKILPIRLKSIDVFDTENPSMAGLLGMDILERFKRVVLTERHIKLIK